MQVKRVTTSGTRTSSEIDLFEDQDVPRALRDEVRDRVGEFLVEQVLDAVASETSPVTGRRFKRLSDSYAKEKKQETGSDSPNLDLSGAMLSELDFRPTRSGVELGVFGSSAPKADGHCNLSGDSELPERRFLPDVGQTFTPKIREGVRQVIADVLADAAKEEISRADFEEVETKAGLYEALAVHFAGLTRAQIKAAVLRQSGLVKLLESLDLLELL